MSLRFNTYRAKRYLRSRFVEGKYLLASEASDLQLESLQILRRSIEKSLGEAVAIEDAWKVELLSANQILIKPGDAWVKGLPFSMRNGKDQLVSGAVLTIGIVPAGVSVSDSTTGTGKILTFNDSAVTPTNLYRLVVSAQEELITDIDDLFLKNLNLTESTAQKIRLIYKLNLVPVSLQSTSPVPYTDETSTSLTVTDFPNSGGFAAPNLSNEVIITPTPGGNGELISTTLITGSEGIDGRDVQLVLRNDSALGGQILPANPLSQTSFANSTLIDSVGNIYHVNVIYIENVNTEITIRIDKEVDQPNPEIINGLPFKFIKRDVFVTDDVNGSPQGKVYWNIAELDWDAVDGFVHSSKITDLRKTISSQEDLQDRTFRQDNLVVTGGGSVSFDPGSSILTWSEDFKIVDAFGFTCLVNADSVVMPDGSALIYTLNLSGGSIIKGVDAVNITSIVGNEITVDPASFSSVEIGNIIVDSAGNADYITALDELNLKITTNSTTLVATGAASIYLDVYAQGFAKLTKNSFVLAVRTGNEVSLNFDKDIEEESEDLNLKLVEGGNWNWDLVNETLSWSADAYIELPGLTTGAENIIAAGSVVISSGEAAYVDITRIPGLGSSLTVNVDNIANILPRKSLVIIARRVGDNVVVGTDSVLLSHNDVRPLQVTSKIEYVSAIDLVNIALPATPTSIDGLAVSVGQKILFTKLSANAGVYVLTNSGWQQLAVFNGNTTPLEGSLISVETSTSNLLGLWQYTSEENWKKLDKTKIENEPTGFKDTTECAFSFNNGTREFVLAPVGTKFDYYVQGRLYRKETAVIFPAIPNTTGLYHFYFDGDTAVSSASFDSSLILGKAYVANVYWNATANEAIMLGEERHGLTMDGATHLYLHTTVGARLGQGLAAGNLTTSGDGSSDTDAQISISNGSIFDEDLKHSITHSASPSANFEQTLDPIARIPIYYRQGATGEWTKINATDFPITKVSVRAGYNDNSGSWSITEAPNDNDFVAMWIFATNNVLEPIVAIMGQRVDSTIDDAEVNNTYESISFGSLPSAEMKVLYRLIFETSSSFTNYVASALRDVRDLRQAIDTSLSAYSVSDHGALSGLLDQDHPASAIYTQPTAFDGTLSVADDDVQKALTTIDKYFAQLQLREHHTNKKRVTITGADKIKTDGTVLAQQIQSLMVNFDGAEIDFETGSIYASDGSTPLGIDFTPATITSSQWRWYSVQAVANAVGSDNRISLQILVLPADADGATQNAAPRAPFGTGIKLGQVAVEMGALTINNIVQSQIVQLGVGSGGSGDGSGDANTLLESLKNQLLDSYFELVTPNIFSSSAASLVDGSSTGGYSLVDKTFNFAANAVQTMVSANMLDTEEFLNSSGTLDEVELSVYWRLANIDTSAVYEVSRNGGTEWQTVSMQRVGSTDLYNGYHKFSDELTNQVLLESTAAATTPLTLDNSAVQSVSQQINISSKKFILRQIYLKMNRNSTPSGNVYVAIHADNGGLPGALLVKSSPRDVTTITVGSPTFCSFDFVSTYLDSGTYHVVVTTDSAYKSSYTTLNYIQVTTNTDVSPLGKKYDGSTWTNISNDRLYARLEGTDLDLRVKVSSSNTAGIKKLEGYGVFYNKVLSASVANSSLNIEVFEFSGSTNTYQFTLNKFMPHPDLLKVYDVNTGQVYDYGAFTLAGQTVIFESGQFYQPGQTIKLRFIQMEGSAFDNSDVNALLMATNHLGATDANIDRSVAGRGIFLRRPDGTLREICIDDNDNIVIYSV